MTNHESANVALKEVGLELLEVRGKLRVYIVDSERFADRVSHDGPLQGEHEIREAVLRAAIKKLRMDRDWLKERVGEEDRRARKLRRELAALKGGKKAKKRAASPSP